MGSKQREPKSCSYLHLPHMQTSTDGKFPAEKEREARDALERNLVRKKKREKGLE